MAAVTVLVSAISCTRPRSYEKFVTISRSQGGLYEFCLDLSDSLASYDIYFYTRALGSGPDTLCLPLMVAWQAPDSTVFEEAVYMRPGGSKGNCELYRSAVVMNPPGEWKLSIRPVEVPKGFCGMGVICKRNDGTR